MSEASNTSHDNPQLFNHVKRPAWGLALLISDEGHIRSYQFEDGELRQFKTGFFHFLEPADLTWEQMEEPLARLQRAADHHRPVSSAGPDRSEQLTLADQIAIFLFQFPGGFADPRWAKDIRGEDMGRRLKRHRAPALDEAGRRLSAERLGEHMAAGCPDKVITSLLEVVSGTDLVPPGQREQLKDLSDAETAELAEALVALLHGEGDLDPRFQRFAHALIDPRWEIATAPAALVQPDQHVCIRPAVFKRQAATMDPRLRHEQLASGFIYGRYQGIAQTTRDKLIEKGHTPRDLVDVHDFIYVTQKASGRKLLAQAKELAAKQQAAKAK